MLRSRIELKIQDAIDRLEQGQPVEDIGVEFKAEWLDNKQKVARLIAAHANAAHGEPIYWAVGVDEKARRVVGVEETEFSIWWAEVHKHFVELAPEPVNVNIPRPTSSGVVTVVGLMFNTEQPPYVVKNPPGRGSADFEVPYRVGNATYSANRLQVLRILAPQQRLPEIEVLGARLEAEYTQTEKNKWLLDLLVYIVPRDRDTLTLPFHRLAATFEFPGITETHNLTHLWCSPFNGFEFQPVECDLVNPVGQIHLSAPGAFHLRARMVSPQPDLDQVVRACSSSARIVFSARPAGTEQVRRVDTQLEPDPAGVGMVWTQGWCVQRSQMDAEFEAEDEEWTRRALN